MIRRGYITLNQRIYSYLTKQAEGIRRVSSTTALATISQTNRKWNVCIFRLEPVVLKRACTILLIVQTARLTKRVWHFSLGNGTHRMSSTTFVIFRHLRTVGNPKTPHPAFYDSTVSNSADWVWRTRWPHTVNPCILNVLSHKRKLNVINYNLCKNLIKFIRLHAVYVLNCRVRFNDRLRFRRTGVDRSVLR